MQSSIQCQDSASNPNLLICKDTEDEVVASVPIGRKDDGKIDWSPSFISNENANSGATSASQSIYKSHHKSCYQFPMKEIEVRNQVQKEDFDPYCVPDVHFDMRRAVDADIQREKADSDGDSFSYNKYETLFFSDDSYNSSNVRRTSNAGTIACAHHRKQEFSQFAAASPPIFEITFGQAMSSSVTAHNYFLDDVCHTNKLVNTTTCIHRCESFITIEECSDELYPLNDNSLKNEYMCCEEESADALLDDLPGMDAPLSSPTDAMHNSPRPLREIKNTNTINGDCSDFLLTAPTQDRLSWGYFFFDCRAISASHRRSTFHFETS